MVKDKKQSKRPTGIRHGKLKRSSATKNVFKTFLTAALVLSLSGLTVAAYAVWDLGSSLSTVSLGQNTDKIGAEFEGEAIEGAFAVALVGSDTREGQSGYQDGVTGELNDVNLLLYVDESHKNATVVSFSRDLMIPIPSCPGPDGEEFYSYPESEGQLNSALDKGGLVCVVRTLEELTGIAIPYAGLITFDGVINMSNAVGGVEVCLTEPIVDEHTDLDLPAGEVTLVGLEALQFLRTRHGVGDGGDASRIGNQQIFMAAMVRQLQSAETFADPVKVFRLAKAAVDNMTLSDSLIDISTMQSMALVLKDLELERINFVQFPVVAHAYDENRFSPDWYAAEELLQVMLSGQAFEVGNLSVAVSDPDAEEELTVEGEEIWEEPIEENLYEDDEFIEEDLYGEEILADGGSAEEGTTGGEGTTDSPIKVNPNVTGQSAAQVTCSQGRTVW